MLVAGFPCQPFSALGTQPAFDDDRGLLFREIVRVLKASKARSFLLENVPGLLECDDGKAIRAIKQDFKGEINWSSVSYGLMNSKRLFN